MRFLLVLVFLLMSNSIFSFSEKDKNKIVGVRIEDVFKYIKSKTYNKKKTLSKNKKYLLKGLKIKGSSIVKVYNSYFREMPNEYFLPLSAFVKTKKNKIFFIDYDLFLDQDGSESYFIRSTSLEKSNFDIAVTLIDRKVVIKDINGQIATMVFPVGVGAFDINVLNPKVSLLTPRFKHGKAWLDKETAEKSKTEPSYFSGKPFVRITTNKESSKGWTSIGFHAQPNLGKFVRAFDSHGCIRMQLKDLSLLYTIISKGPLSHTPITVSYKTKDALDHPMPRMNKEYKAVKNQGSTENPQYKIDKNGLVQIHKTNEKEVAPIDQLLDRSNDHYHDLFDYEMKWREEGQQKDIRKRFYNEIFISEEDNTDRTRKEKEKEDEKDRKIQEELNIEHERRYEEKREEIERREQEEIERKEREAREAQDRLFEDEDYNYRDYDNDDYQVSIPPISRNTRKLTKRCKAKYAINKNSKRYYVSKKHKRGLGLAYKRKLRKAWKRYQKDLKASKAKIWRCING